MSKDRSPRYEAICDRCLETFTMDSAHLDDRDCPLCGVGRILGPWPVRRRFPRRPLLVDTTYPRREDQEPAGRA